MTTHFNTRLTSFQAMQQSNLLSFLLSYLTGQAAQPNYAQYLDLNKALQCGDPQMEKVLTWMMQNPKQHREYFEIALFKGVEQLPFSISRTRTFF